MSGAVSSFDEAAEADRAAIRRLLDSHLESWNGGDLDGLLDTYVQDESVRYASASTVVHGIDRVRERFRRAYPDWSRLGELRYEDVVITLAGPADALVFGRAWISRGDGDDATSLFSLHLKKRDGQWWIAADHTSA
ncbi:MULTISPECIES: nuclear transport factor 2 family protein [unclassified Nocardioides]|uniref:nuclear transport factor 2 family protein n=1 Tax=unclassified Nocardioides TaxID=2615069 RepID=UPI0009EF85F0|nr:MULTISPECIES: nuclear transport factor 2 family protein [unclassified Nocardioides]GAW50254.1 uncharacterized protein PD653B2_2585 [Nocardioides sp. PD653-B2]GAW52976.1 uncharacterized protein PD653_0370 [Nocardioides sp. PD653]